ncbi:MAG: hypothetical protein ACJ0GR_03450 [Prochlorococcaceae cyanobacterium]
MPAKPLPNTGALSGLKETLDFFGDPGFAQRRFENLWRCLRHQAAGPADRVHPRGAGHQ